MEKDAKELFDRIGVKIDPSVVLGTLITKDTTKDEIVKMMVGRVIFGDKKEESTVPADAPVVLEVKNLCRGKEIKNVSFNLRKGEILGFSGLMGSGRTEVARAIYGADPFDCGEIYVNGKKVNIKTPEEAVKNGICYLSEDRKRYGLLLDKSVAENSVLSNLDDYIKAGWIQDGKIEKDAKRENQKLKTKTPSMSQLLKNLSGGNQQKVIIARWLLKNSDIFIFDEPTRGIDLSIGTTCIAAAVIAGKLYMGGMPLGYTIPVMIAIGALIGFINGLLVAKLKIPAFIATLGTMMFGRGLSAIIVSIPNIFFPNGTWFNKMFSNYNGTPVGLIWVVFFALICMYLMYKCKIGRYILSIGSNEEATRLSGINTDKYKIIAYTIAGISTGIAAIFWAASFATVAAATGNGMELDAIAGVYIGGTSAAGGVASIAGSVIGAIMLACKVQPQC